MDHFLENREVRWTTSMITEGLTRIIYGLIKRFVLVELVLAPLMATHPTIRHLIVGLQDASILDVWRYLIFSYLVAYLDFSAYTDIAIGCSRLFGFTIMENFRLPIASTNIAEFWRRWHMTLAGWCQQYVYMPIIGWTRNPYLAIYLTFITMGLWHAASLEWLAWALYHATGVVVYNQWARRHRGSRAQPSVWKRVFGTSLTFLFVSAGYAFTTAHGQATVFDSFRVLAAAIGVRPLLQVFF
jgi:alginate O-acetyltransferase complex protein AlgI